MAEIFKGLFRIHKVQENETALITSKNSKHGNLVNINLLLEYNKQREINKKKYQTMSK
jgi:hypothetical protein